MEPIYTGDKKCSFCGELINVEAKRCPYCGSLLGMRADQLNTYIENNEQSNYNRNESNTFDSQSGVPDDVEKVKEVDKADPADSIPAGQSRYTANPYTGSTGQVMGNPRPFQTYQNSYGQYRGYSAKRPLSNGLKVFLTVLFTMIPGVGQLAGIIASILFMADEGDKDRRSFGMALLIACLVFFIMTSLVFFLIMLAILGSKA